MFGRGLLGDRGWSDGPVVKGIGVGVEALRRMADVSHCEGSAMVVITGGGSSS